MPNGRRTARYLAYFIFVAASIIAAAGLPSPLLLLRHAWTLHFRYSSSFAQQKYSICSVFIRPVRASIRYH